MFKLSLLNAGLVKLGLFGAGFATLLTVLDSIEARLALIAATVAAAISILRQVHALAKVAYRALVRIHESIEVVDRIDETLSAMDARLRALEDAE